MYIQIHLLSLSLSSFVMLNQQHALLSCNDALGKRRARLRIEQISAYLTKLSIPAIQSRSLKTLVILECLGNLGIADLFGVPENSQIYG